MSGRYVITQTMPLESIPIAHARRSRRTRRKVVVSENWLFNSLEVSTATPSPFMDCLRSGLTLLVRPSVPEPGPVVLSGVHRQVAARRHVLQNERFEKIGLKVGNQSDENDESFFGIQDLAKMDSDLACRSSYRRPHGRAGRRSTSAFFRPTQELCASQINSGIESSVSVPR
jgi:hypothetical protein